MRHQATPEQKAAAEARRAKIKELCAQISALPAEKRAEIGLSLGIRNTAGHELSPYNQMLLHSQRASVSIVGGFQQWREVGRRVMKGAKALAIWVPTGKGKNSAPNDEGERQKFICGNVFDISDTEPMDSTAQVTPLCLTDSNTAA
jgi:hypothetical protein